MPRLRTFMSPVMYRTPSEGSSCSNSGLKGVAIEGRPLCWLDELLNGGLEIPKGSWNQEDSEPAYVLLIAGPPGTGKTTFASELCYNLARFPQPDDAPIEDGWKSLYVTSETTAERFIENVKAFGWDASFFQRYEGKSLQRNCCTVYGCDQLDLSSDLVSIDYEKFFESFMQTWLRRVGDDEWEVILESAFDVKSNSNPDIAQPQNREALPPDVLVLDSLNVLQPDPSTGSTQIGNAFRNLLRWLSKGKKSPRLLIIVLDGYQDSAAHSSWEYLVDAAIRLDAGDCAVGLHGYYVRSLQIIKARMQAHAWGKHTFKIYPAVASEYGSGVKSKRTAKKPAKLLRTKPPCLQSGGTFVFPSVHWHLSRARDFQHPEFQRNEFYATGLDELDFILGDDRDTSGFPALQSTALLGRRGAMKSHLAYWFMLSHAIGAVHIDPVPKNILLISLRDDLDAAKNTLVKILEQQGVTTNSSCTGQEVLQSLIDDDRLEILYYPPGCIASGEFIHRVFVALARERATNDIRMGTFRLEAPNRNRAEIVVLNGLDHLDAKFPLCATDRVFTPALASLFRSFNVCSVIVSAEAKSLSYEADLHTMADLILEFSDIGAADAHCTREDIVRLCGEPKGLVQAVEVQASRVPAGQIGGRWGILGRASDGRLSFHPAGGTRAVEVAMQSWVI